MPEEVELNGGMRATPARVLAVDDPGLFRMDFQTALLPSDADGLKQCLRLSPCRGVNHPIIRIAFEPDVRISPPHPFVNA